MKIIIAGGSGLIGQALSADLRERGNEVWVLTRSPARAQMPQGVRTEAWDGRTALGWGGLVDGADAIINLAGASIGARPWSNERKRLLRSSRIEAGQAIVAAVQASARRPKVLLQIIGVGIYGTHGDEPLDESAAAGSDFLAQLAADWEKAIQPVAELGVRLAVLPTGVVLAPKGGVLAPFILQNRLFAGGPLGSARQWISWIHIRDLVRAFEFLLEREDGQGRINVTSPQPVTNAEFERTVSKAMHRPYWIPAPAFALRLALGEMSSLVLEGQRVLPRRLLEMGFEFEFGELQKALDDLLK